LLAPPFWNTVASCIKASGLGYGSGRSSTPFTTLKIAVLAPMPSARVSTATVVKPGLRRKVRSE